MAVEWIKNNMLHFNSGRNRQLTEAELIVQPDQKPSTPDWYLNKRSNSSKILKIIPTKCRLLSWKNSTSRRNCTSNSSSSNSIDICPHVKENVHEKAKKVSPPITSYKNEIFSQQMLPETKHTRSSTKSSSPKEEILHVNIPIMKFPRQISNTFPRISPSRKGQNINLVLPAGPKIKLSKDLEDMYDYNNDDSRKTFVLKEQQFNVTRTTKIEDLRNIDVIIDKKRENRQTNVSFQAFEVVTTPSSTPDVEPKFFTYAKSNPKFSQASEVLTTPSSTPEVEPKFFNYAKFTPKFSQPSEVMTTLSSTPDVEPEFSKYAKSNPKFSQPSEVVTTPSSTPDVEPKFFNYAKFTPKFSQPSEFMTTPSSTPDVEPKFFTYAKSNPKFSQASEVLTTPSSTPEVEPKFFNYAKFTPKFSQPSEVMTTLSSTPDVQPKFFTYAKSNPKFSQASEVLTTPSSTPDVEPKFFTYAKSNPKFSQPSEVLTTPSSTPDVEPNFFKYRTKSTLKFSQPSEIMTTPSNTPDVKPKFFKLRTKSTLKFSQPSEIMTTPSNTPDVKPKFFKLRANSTPKSSQAQLVSSAIIKFSPKEKIISPSILEKSLIFENKSMNMSNNSVIIRRSKKVSPNLLERTFFFENNLTYSSFKESCNSIYSEFPLRSKQLNRKNIVREIVRNLNEKIRKSEPPRHGQDGDKERFVKQIVNALEKGDISRMRNLSRSSINDEDSPSESETKSYVTSNSPKDTDYSDYGRRSPTRNSDNDRTFNCENFKEDTLKVKEKNAEDDSVYWISIPRSTLPRSSSLVSITSKLSAHDLSPCISPIKSPNEVEYSLQTSWGATYKTSNPLSKKLFHETVVIDSGYSD